MRTAGAQGLRRRWVLASCLVAGGSVLSACTGAPARSAAVDLRVVGDTSRGTDSTISCVLRVAPDSGGEQRGATTECTAPAETPVRLQLQLAPGRYVLQAVRSSCPGMPGDCSGDPYAEQYATDRYPFWSCDVEAVLAADQRRALVVDLTADAGRRSCSLQE